MTVYTYSGLYTHALVCKQECNCVEIYINAYMYTHTYINTRAIYNLLVFT